MIAECVQQLKLPWPVMLLMVTAPAWVMFLLIGVAPKYLAWWDRKHKR